MKKVILTLMLSLAIAQMSNVFAQTRQARIKKSPENTLHAGLLFRKRWDNT